jgi:hypothetical protein
MATWLALVAAGWAIAAAGTKTFPSMSDGERAGWLFALIPAVGVVCAVLVTNAFTPRYFINVIPGVAVAFACLMSRILVERRRMSALLCAILVGFGGSRILWSMRHAEDLESFGWGSYQAEVRAVLGYEERIWLDGKKVTLLPGLLVMPAQYYSRHPERYKKWSPEPPPSDAIVPAWHTDTVVAHAREIAFVNPEPRLLERLRTANLKLDIKRADSVMLVYAE